MFREYQDTRIQRNLEIVKALSKIAVILWCFCASIYLLWKWYRLGDMLSHPKNLSWTYVCRFWGGVNFFEKILNGTENPQDVIIFESVWDLEYCAAYLFLAYGTYSFSKKFAQKPHLWLATVKKQKRYASKKEQESIKESRRDNDVSRILPYVVLDLIPVAVLVAMLLVGFIVAMGGWYGYISSGMEIVSTHLGYMLLSHVSLIISSGFLIQNCVLIKREWKINPPEFIVEERQKAEEEAERKKREQDAANCKALLEECGMQFFVEYYLQIKRLPIRDVTVSNNYLAEREVRLTAAKKIFDSGLNKYALGYIIKSYGDILPSETIARAQTILNEIENDKGESK